MSIGNAEALMMLAALYEVGHDKVPVTRPNALEYLKKAASLGNAHAILMLEYEIVSATDPCMKCECY